MPAVVSERGTRKSAMVGSHPSLTAGPKSLSHLQLLRCFSPKSPTHSLRTFGTSPALCPCRNPGQDAHRQLRVQSLERRTLLCGLGEIIGDQKTTHEGRDAPCPPASPAPLQTPSARGGRTGRGSLGLEPCGGSGEITVREGRTRLC